MSCEDQMLDIICWWGQATSCTSLFNISLIRCRKASHCILILPDTNLIVINVTKEYMHRVQMVTQSMNMGHFLRRLIWNPAECECLTGRTTSGKWAKRSNWNEPHHLGFVASGWPSGGKWGNMKELMIRNVQIEQT